MTKQIYITGTRNIFKSFLYILHGKTMGLIDFWIVKGGSISYLW